MKAFTRQVYGGPEILKMEEITRAEPAAKEVQVQVMANSANPADLHILSGSPFFARFNYGLFKPKNKLTGSDFAGIIVAVGKDVADFKPGDHVFESTLAGGAFAEYLNVPGDACAIMPEGADFHEMASLPIAGVTALEALVHYGKLQPGEKVLINGATGGVGHFAVQIAKALGARVTAVCSANSSPFARQLGADEVLAYEETDLRQHQGQYDLVVDAYGNLRYKDFKRIGKRGVAIGFTNMKTLLSLALKKKSGKPHIHQTYLSDQIPEAIRHIETSHIKGKAVMVREKNEEKIDGG